MHTLRKLRLPFSQCFQRLRLFGVGVTMYDGLYDIRRRHKNGGFLRVCASALVGTFGDSPSIRLGI